MGREQEQFQLKIPEDQASSKFFIQARTKSIIDGYFFPDKNRVIDQKLHGFFENLKSGRFWGVIEDLDGRINSKKEDKEKARIWARQHFTQEELQSIFEICVATALTVPYKANAPGSYKGHSILYEETIEKSDSMFADAITENFKKRLNNGRFWEELCGMSVGLNKGHSYNVVGDVLTNHLGDLDLAFVPQGIKIFKRNTQGYVDFDLSNLSNLEINRYAQFLSSIDEHLHLLGLKNTDLEPLITPYVREVISFAFNERHNEEGPRFRKGSRRGYPQRLKEPLLAKYLSYSDFVRDNMAKELAAELTYGSKPFAFDVLKNVPNIKDMFDRIVNQMSHPEDDLAEVVAFAKEESIPLNELLGSKSVELLQKAGITL